MLTFPNQSRVAGVCWMLTPEIRVAPADCPVSPGSLPARVTTGTTRPLSVAYIELSPSRTYEL
ncbi:hypothetical protein ACFQZC_32715 [Streptacidiphilus monticola]